MKPGGRAAVALTLIGIGVTAILWTAVAASPALGHFRWVLAGAGLFILAGAGVLYRPRPHWQREIDARAAAVSEMEAALQERAEGIHRRQRELARQLMQLHEWAEWPGAGPAGPGEERPPDVAEDIGQKDRAVVVLLEKRTQDLFEKIKTNAYGAGGEFQRDRFLEDIVGLVEAVARIYHPDSRRPLLETSIERLLRAVNRISLQLLLLLEGLPLDIPSHNLQTTYETVRKGVRAYGVYRSAAPYLSAARPVYYLGRYAIGAAPMTLGAGWALSELFKKGAKRLSTNMANRYALGLLRDGVRIIGGEAAGVFGGDYRYRDPHWIYGAELTELLAAAPPSAAPFRAALAEINGLSLRNEYDRIFLYRCLAAGQSALPERFAVPDTLDMAQRADIAARLERFHRRHLRDSGGDLSGWRRDAEGRLGVRIRWAEPAAPATDPTGDAVGGVVSLAGFLAEVKGLEPEDWPPILSGTRMFQALDPTGQSALLRDLEAAPPMIFSYPDLAAGDPRVDEYLADLISLTVRVAPRNEEIDEQALSAAHHFRAMEAAPFRKRLDREYVSFLADCLQPDSPEKRVRPSVARALVCVLTAVEEPRFLYSSVTLREREGREEEWPFPLYAEPWLMGTDHRLVLVAVNRKFQSGPILVWTGDRPGATADAAAVSRWKERFRVSCRLTGGRWHWDRIMEADASPAIVIPGPAMGRGDRFFRPMEDWFRIGFRPNGGDGAGKPPSIG